MELTLHQFKIFIAFVEYGNTSRVEMTTPDPTHQVDSPVSEIDSGGAESLNDQWLMEHLSNASSISRPSF